MEPKIDRTLGGLDQSGVEERRKFVDQLLNLSEEQLNSLSFLAEEAEPFSDNMAIVFQFEGRVIKLTPPEHSFTLSSVDKTPLLQEHAKLLWEKFKPLADKYIQKP